MAEVCRISLSIRLILFVVDGGDELLELIFSHDGDEAFGEEVDFGGVFGGEVVVGVFFEGACVVDGEFYIGDVFFGHVAAFFLEG